jgi:hypothetical protein
MTENRKTKPRVLIRPKGLCPALIGRATLPRINVSRLINQFVEVSDWCSTKLRASIFRCFSEKLEGMRTRIRAAIRIIRLVLFAFQVLRILRMLATAIRFLLGGRARFLFEWAFEVLSELIPWL